MGQPVVVARLQPAFGDGADQQPPRPGFNFETHYIRGLARMKTRVGLALAVMMALALGQARAGHAGRMRSLVGAGLLHDTG